MWSNQVFHALMKALKAVDQDSSFELPPLMIRGQQVVIKCHAPRGYAVDVVWGGLELNGYHGSLCDRDFETTFGFNDTDIETVAAFADRETRRLAKEKGVLPAVDAILAEWSLTPEQRYFRDLEELCGDLTDDQAIAVEKYGWTFLDCQKGRRKLQALVEAFIALILDQQIPRETAVQIQLVNDKHKGIN